MSWIVIISPNHGDYLCFEQEKQLKEAAKNNEEAQAVINQLRVSLQQLEHRLKQARTSSFWCTSSVYFSPFRKTSRCTAAFAAVEAGCSTPRIA